jgi:hypothetical protein
MASYSILNHALGKGLFGTMHYLYYYKAEEQSSLTTYSKSNFNNRANQSHLQFIQIGTD